MAQPTLTIPKDYVAQRPAPMGPLPPATSRMSPLGVSSKASDFNQGNIDYTRAARQPQQQPQGAPDDSPQGLVAQQLQMLQESFAGRIENLKASKPDVKSFDAQIDSWQREYNGQKQDLADKMNRMDVMQGFMDDGTVDQAAGRKAQLSLIMNPTELAAMFPKPEAPPRDRVISPSMLRAYSELAGDFADAAKVDPAAYHWYTANEDENGPRLRDSLISQYRRYQDITGYWGSDTSPATQRKLDMSWDDKLKSNDKKYAAWNPADVIALRPYASELSKSFARVAGGPWNKHFRDISEASRKLIEGARAKKQEDTPGPKTVTRELAIQLIREAGGDKTKARELAAQRGYTF